jgi:hypothetical protein
MEYIAVKKVVMTHIFHYTYRLKNLEVHMKKLLVTVLLTLCVTLLKINYTNNKVYAFEEGVAGFAGIAPLLEKVSPTINWTTVNVNFRIEPSINSEIICTIKKRNKVQKYIDYGKWTLISYENQFGYVSSQYLRDMELFTSDKNRWGINLTNDEIDLLAKIIWLESQGETDKGQQAVVEVVLNRMLSLDYPDTLYEILSQKNQFSTWKNRNIAKPTDKEYNNIRKVLNNETDILGFDTVYFSKKAKNNNITCKIGNHYFCKEDE